jgi:hypothetical protein
MLNRTRQLSSSLRTVRVCESTDSRNWTGGWKEGSCAVVLTTVHKGKAPFDKLERENENSRLRRKMSRP